MKKFTVCALVLLCVISMTSCNNISEYLTEDEGIQFLILPISKSRVRIDEQHKFFRERITK